MTEKWNNGARTAGPCQTSADLDSGLSASQVQVALSETHGEDGPPDPLCFWCVSRPAYIEESPGLGPFWERKPRDDPVSHAASYPTCLLSATL